MSYWKLFKNVGLFIKFFRDLVNLIKYVSQYKTMSTGLVSIMIQDLESIFESGAIDIPGVDEHDIANVLEQIRANLTK